MNTNHRREERLIGATRKIAAVLLLTIVSLTHVMVPTAHAGFWSWLTGQNTQASDQTAGISSEQQLQSNLLFQGMDSDEDTVESAIVANALLPHASTGYEPAAGTYRYQMTLEVSAYNSEPAQTDDSPFITAWQTHVRDGIVATNILPFGTRVKMPYLFGDKVFVVEDRMNSRYQNHMDLWMEDKDEALRFGRRTTVIEVIR
jgi:3D (Asp-Asp-Asp) domain-containing protein